MCISCDVTKECWAALERITQFKMGTHPGPDTFDAATNAGINLIASMAHIIPDLNNRHAFLVDVVRKIEAVAMDANMSGVGQIHH